MNLELVEVLWKYGKFPASKLPQIAGRELINGVYGDATAEIAGMSEPDDEEIGDLFEKSILEIKKKFIGKQETTFVLAKGIVEKDIEPFEGASLMAMLYEELGRPGHLRIFKELYEEYTHYLPPRYNVHLKENKLIPVFKRSCDKDILRAAGEFLTSAKIN